MKCGQEPDLASEGGGGEREADEQGPRDANTVKICYNKNWCIWEKQSYLNEP